jgi:HEAT repeat protein
MAELAAGAGGDEIVRQLLHADKLRRKALLTLSGVLGESAVPLLFRALCDCPTRSSRQELCDLLVALGPATRRFLAAELEKKTLPWYFQRNLINLMGRVGDLGSLPILARFLADKHPRVRLEAILATCALEEGRAERVLLAGLADPDPDVRAVSLRQLVQRRSLARELFAHLRDTLGRPEETGLEPALQACNLLAGYSSGDGRERAADLLLEVLSDEPRKGFWSRLAGDSDLQGTLKAAACQALGRLQAGRAVPELTRLAEGKDKAVRAAALRALRAIQAAPAAPEVPGSAPVAPRPS